MHTFTSLLILIFHLHLTLALPPKAPQKFRLLTHVTSGSSSKNNLYVQTYHTGAGLSDSVLVRKHPASSPSQPSRAFLNGTYLQFDLGTEFPWGFYMGGAVNYAGWEDVEINVGYGSGGFYINNTDGSGVRGLKWNPGWPYQGPDEGNEFVGWLACDWFHGLPQLFWRVRNGVLGFNSTLIATCSEVELIREFV